MAIKDFDVPARDLRELNNVLRNSFAGIKRDMNDLKSGISAQSSTARQLKEKIDEMKKDFVTKDQLNVLKIKVGDINEDLKDFRRLDDKFSEMQDRVTDKIKKTNKDTYDAVKDINKKVETNVKDLDRKNDDNVRELDRKIETNLKKIDKKIENNLRALDKKLDNSIQDTKQNSITTKEYLKHKSDLTNKVTAMKKSVGAIESKGGKIFKSKIKSYSKVVDKRFDEQNRSINGLRDDVSNTVTRLRDDNDDKLKRLQVDINTRVKSVQVEKLIQDVNKEFDVLKDNFSKEIEKLDKEFKKKGKFVGRNQLERLVKDINKEFDRLKETVEIIRDEVKESKRDSVPRHIFEKQNEELLDHISVLKQEIKLIQKDSGNGIQHVAKPIRAELKRLDKQTKKVIVRAPHRKKYLMGNLLIGLAFVLLAASIIVFFLEKTWLINWIIGGAILSFIVGMILRIIVVVKSRD